MNTQHPTDPFGPHDETPAELRGVRDLLDALGAHERASAPNDLEESVLMSLSLASTRREAMAAAPGDLEERVFAATRGMLATGKSTTITEEEPPALRLVGEGTLPREPKLSPRAVRRALEPRGAWWRGAAMRTAAVLALMCVPVLVAYRVIQGGNVLKPTTIVMSDQPDESSEPQESSRLAMQIDADLDRLLAVVDDTVSGSDVGLTSSGTAAGETQNLDDDWFGMAEFLSEDAL